MSSASLMSSLSLEEKKRRILRSVCRLEASGLLRPPHSLQQLLHMIAQVSISSRQVRQREACFHLSSLLRTSVRGVCGGSGEGRSFTS